jgi:membrane protease YdiL (CAAX protease family)
MGIGFPALAHPGEVFASLAWFGMVTWLLIRTKNIWDCVAAHAITNLLLGIYVLTFDQWQLW